MVTWRKVLDGEQVGDPIEVQRLPGGQRVYRHGRSLVVLPKEDSAVLSSAYYHGGVFDRPSAVFNTTGIGGEAEMDLMHGPRENYLEYCSRCAEKIGLDPATVVGLGTAVTMDKAAVVSETFGNLSVSAVVTAGVEGNGGRVGDPASYDETEKYHRPSGTIVIILVVDADLPVQTMARCIMTATEAKTAALQELMASSRYSEGIATGSGTDQIAVVCDRGSELRLTDAGKHSKLGELIGRCVLAAVKRALGNWAGMTPESRMDALIRLDRFRIPPDFYIDAADASGRDGFAESLAETARRPEVVAAAAAAIHLHDEMAWGICDRRSGTELARRTIASVCPGFEPDMDEGIPRALARAVSRLALRSLDRADPWRNIPSPNPDL